MNHNINHIMLTSHLHSASPSTQIVDQQGDEYKKPRGRYNKKMNEEQVNILENTFQMGHNLGCERRDMLAMALGLNSRQVAVWFQNRKASWKKKKLEEEYSNLKKAHEATTLEKSLLETEVLRLTEKLSEAEKEIQALKHANRISSNSHRLSQQSLEVVADPPFSREFNVDEYYDDAVLYAQPQTHYSNHMKLTDWYN